VGVVAWIAICFASWYLALWLFGIPTKVVDATEAEGIGRKLHYAWWTNMLINVVLCVLVFHLLPAAWRRWLHRNSRGPSHGQVAG